MKYVFIICCIFGELYCIVLGLVWFVMIVFGVVISGVGLGCNIWGIIVCVGRVLGVVYIIGWLFGICWAGIMMGCWVDCGIKVICDWVICMVFGYVGIGVFGVVWSCIFK